MTIKELRNEYVEIKSKFQEFSDHCEGHPVDEMPDETWEKICKIADLLEEVGTYLK